MRWWESPTGGPQMRTNVTLALKSDIFQRLFTINNKHYTFLEMSRCVQLLRSRRALHILSCLPRGQRTHHKTASAKESKLWLVKWMKWEVQLEWQTETFWKIDGNKMTRHTSATCKWMMDRLMYRTWTSTRFLLSAQVRHQEVKEEAVNDQHEHYNHLAAMARPAEKT